MDESELAFFFFFYGAISGSEAGDNLLAVG
jgi:hypothetical protein